MERSRLDAGNRCNGVTSARPRDAVRWIAIFYVVAGTLAIVNALVPAEGISRPTVIVLGMLDLAIAAVASRLPWERWPLWSTLVFVPVTIAAIELFASGGVLDAGSYPLFFVVMFIWIGVSHPPRTSFLMAPLAAAGYLVPIVSQAPVGDVGRSVSLIVPVCVTIAEIISRSRARAEENARIAAEALARKEVEGKEYELQRVTFEAQRERAELLEQLSAAQRLDALGRLAGGVAHDFNNLLSVIVNYTQFVLDDLDDDSPAKPDLLEVRGAAQRAANLTQELLIFGRRNRTQENARLEEAVITMRPLLERSIGNHLRLTVDVGDEASTVGLSRTSIEQIALNLVVNAADAMPRGGDINVTVDRVILESPILTLFAEAPPGAYARLRVADEGAGMSREIISKIFEPFFTTKEAGEGTGLGLATVYWLVKQGEGFLSIDSVVGQGTTFEILLLLVEVTEMVSDDTLAPSQGHSERVLVVDGDEGVLRVAKAILCRGGYRPLTARDAAQALELLARHGRDVAVLVTESILAGMPGSELVEVARAHNPELAAVLMSGHRRGLVLDHREPVLRKPFTVTTLLNSVDQALASRVRVRE